MSPTVITIGTALLLLTAQSIRYFTNHWVHKNKTEHSDTDVVDAPHPGLLQLTHVGKETQDALGLVVHGNNVLEVLSCLIQRRGLWDVLKAD